MNLLKVKTWADIENNLGDTTQLEREYRRGYRDGFIAATEAIHRLWFLKGKQHVYDALWDFWQKDLVKWQRSEPYHSFNFPPDCVVPCVYCGRPASQLDHYMPKALGGSDSRSNLVPACKTCNQSKSDLHPEVWDGRLNGG